MVTGAKLRTVREVAFDKYINVMCMWPINTYIYSVELSGMTSLRSSIFRGREFVMHSGSNSPVCSTWIAFEFPMAGETRGGIKTIECAN